MTDLDFSLAAQSHSRRFVLRAGGGALAIAVAGPALLRPYAALADTVPVEELMKAGDLTDMAIGPVEAKVVIVEYASMTCGHCARFHVDVYPKLKAKYIDTGKVRFIMREFPLDNRAAAASMLARCAGAGKDFPLVSVLFERQEDWAFVKGSPVDAMFELAKQAGFTREAFDTCLKDNALFDKIKVQRERAASVFGVNSTPTFFINGERLKGGGTIEEFEKIIDPILAKG
ncbi:MAG: DsbA family protein [Hyphomicrobiaceae bacterium]|nr:DsbA family protein [Hyphomicrobiaceae bacterium]